MAKEPFDFVPSTLRSVANLAAIFVFRCILQRLYRQQHSAHRRLLLAIVIADHDIGVILTGLLGHFQSQALEL